MLMFPFIGEMLPAKFIPVKKASLYNAET